MHLTQRPPLDQSQSARGAAFCRDSCAVEGALRLSRCVSRKDARCGPRAVEAPAQSREALRWSRARWLARPSEGQCAARSPAMTRARERWGRVRRVVRRGHLGRQGGLEPTWRRRRSSSRAPTCACRDVVEPANSRRSSKNKKVGFPPSLGGSTKCGASSKQREVT